MMIFFIASGKCFRIGKGSSQFIKLVKYICNFVFGNVGYWKGQSFTRHSLYLITVILVGILPNNLVYYEIFVNQAHSGHVDTMDTWLPIIRGALIFTGVLPPGRGKLSINPCHRVKWVNISPWTHVLGLRDMSIVIGCWKKVAINFEKL